MRQEPQPISFIYPTAKIVFRHGDETLTLRPQCQTDAPLVHAAIHASLPELRTYMAWSHKPPTLEDSLARARQAHADYWANRDQIFCLWRGEDEMVGSFGLHKRALNSRAVEIGYWMHSAFAGKNRATAAVKALLVYAFDYLRCQRVQCGATETNLASLQVIQKCGFRVEGLLQYHMEEGTPAMIAAGFSTCPTTVFHSLNFNDVKDLPWFDDTRRTLQVFNWCHQLVEPA